MHWGKSKTQSDNGKLLRVPPKNYFEVSAFADGPALFYENIISPISLSLRKLRRDTPVCSHYEEMVKLTLLKRSILAFYEYNSYPVSIKQTHKDYMIYSKEISKARSRIYYNIDNSPDFITSLFAEDKLVILEPHGLIPYALSDKPSPNEIKHFTNAVKKQKRYFNKLKRFGKQYNMFYIVMILNEPQAETEARLDMKLNECCDEVWHIPTSDKEELMEERAETLDKYLSAFLKRKDVRLATDEEIVSCMNEAEMVKSSLLSYEFKNHEEHFKNFQNRYNRELKRLNRRQINENELPRKVFLIN